MAESHRLNVLKRLTALIEEVAVSEGYDFDLRGCVSRGRSTYGENDPDTLISILESINPDPGIYGGADEVRRENWRLLLQGWAPDDKMHPADNLYLLAADIENMLMRITLQHPHSGEAAYPEWYLLGRNEEGQPMISSFKLSPPVIRPPTENVSSKSYFYIAVEIGLALDVG